MLSKLSSSAYHSEEKRKCLSVAEASNSTFTNPLPRVPTVQFFEDFSKSKLRRFRSSARCMAVSNYHETGQKKKKTVFVNQSISERLDFPTAGLNHGHL